MPDSIQPVGTMYPPVNPLAALSSIIGIKQQQQNLQTGQYAQQSAQAKSQVDQINANEMQAISNLAKSAWTSGRYKGDDGNFDNQKFASDVMAVAPVNGGQIAKDATMRAGELYKNQQTYFNLTKDKQDQLAGTTEALASDPNVDHTKVNDAFENIRRRFRGDDQLSAMLQSMGGAIDPNAKGPQLQQILNQMTAAMKGQNSQTAMTGPGGQIINRGTYSNQLSPVGGAPGVSQGTMNGLNPNTPTVAGATTAATGGAKTVVEDPFTHNKAIVDLQRSAGGTPVGPQRSLGEGESAIATVGGITGRVQQAQAAANNTVQSQDALSRAKAILESPESPSTGTQYENVKSLKNLMSSLGIDTKGADDMNTLTKNLARYEASRATQAGLGGTDAARELAHSGSPNTQLDNKALLGIVRQSLATEQAVASYANVQSKTKDPQKMIENENAFRNIPNHIQAREFGMMRNPQEANSYLQSQGMTKAQMAAARQKLKEFDGQ